MKLPITRKVPVSRARVRRTNSDIEQKMKVP